MTRNLEILSYEHRLDHLFDQTKLLPEEPPLIRSHWARYLCVLSAGYLETSIQILFSELARKTAHPYVANYVENKLRSFHSASMGNIIELTRLFNTTWADYLEMQTKGKLGDHVNSIVKNRHQIAHGKNVGVSLAYITEWHKSAVKVIELIENLCK